MKLYTQADQRWESDIMTFPKHQNKPDTLKQYGCLVTALCNAYNCFNFSKHKELTPKQLNELLHIKKGYAYLKNENCKKGNESFLLWDVVKPILGITDKANNYKGKIDIKHVYDYYIARTVYKDTGHYSLVVGKNMTKQLIVFDSYTGKRTIIKDYIITKITFGAV